MLSIFLFNLKDFLYSFYTTFQTSENLVETRWHDFRVSLIWFLAN